MTKAKAAKPTSRSCTPCGFTGTYQSPALAAFHFPKHSCERNLEAIARAGRVADHEANRGGVKRDCQCLIARHEHGNRTTYVVDRCRCLPCLDASIAWEKQRRRDRLYGRPTGRVDAEPVRRHVRYLMDHGTSYKTTAKRSGVPLTTLTQLLYGRPDRRGHRPPYTCQAAFAEKILAVQPDPWLLPDGCRMDAIGTHRRVQALVTQGWSQSQLCVRVGVDRSNWFIMMQAPTITAKRARAIRDLYEQLWDTPPPASNQRERRAVTMALRHATAHGWLPPLAWDDDTIDLPGIHVVELDAEDYDEIAVERIMAGTLQVPLNTKSPELLEAIRRLAAFGHSDRVIAERVGRKRDSVTQQRLRNNIPSAALPGGTKRAIATIARQAGASAGGTPEPTRRHPAA